MIGTGISWSAETARVASGAPSPCHSEFSSTNAAAAGWLQELVGVGREGVRDPELSIPELGPLLEAQVTRPRASLISALISFESPAAPSAPWRRVEALVEVKGRFHHVCLGDHG